MASLKGANTGPVVKWVEHTIKPVHYHSPKRNVFAQGVSSIHVCIIMTMGYSPYKEILLADNFNDLPFEEIC
jgi:hypothetical protein